MPSAKAPHPLVDGVVMRLGGREWTIAPLTLGQLRRLWPRLHALGDATAMMGEDDIAIVVEIVTAALSRNYPEITATEVEDLLDLGNAGTVLNAVMTGSGLRPAMGETEPAAGRTISPSFTPNSPPAADMRSP